jgi:hypothetical protein
MQTTYKITPEGNKGCHLVELTISLSSQMQQELTEPLCIISGKTVSFPLLQFPDGSICPATGHSINFKGETIPVKCFQLRLAPVASHNKNARLRVFIPGKIKLGYTTEPQKAEEFMHELIQELPAKAADALNKTNPKDIRTRAGSAETIIPGAEGEKTQALRLVELD